MLDQRKLTSMETIQFWSQEKCTEEELAMLTKLPLTSNISIMIIDNDSIVWVKYDKSLFADYKDVCFVYMCMSNQEFERSEFYRIYDCGIFEILEEIFKRFRSYDHVFVAGNFNGREAKKNNFVEKDCILNTFIPNDLSNIVPYDPVCIWIEKQKT